jgi:hypothetical protein
VSVALAHHDDRFNVDRGRGDPRHGGCPAAIVGNGERPGRGGAGVSVGVPSPLTPPSIDFLREEVADICGALALGGSLLRRLGLGAEAVRFESLYGAVAARLDDGDQLSPEPSPS